MCEVQRTQTTSETIIRFFGGALASGPIPIHPSANEYFFARASFQGKEAMLHFIEDYLGLSPDGGDGSIEVLLVVAVILMSILIALRVGAKLNTGRLRRP